MWIMPSLQLVMVTTMHQGWITGWSRTRGALAGATKVSSRLSVASTCAVSLIATHTPRMSLRSALLSISGSDLWKATMLISHPGFSLYVSLHCETLTLHLSLDNNFSIRYNIFRLIIKHHLWQYKTNSVTRILILAVETNRIELKLRLAAPVLLSLWVKQGYKSAHAQINYTLGMYFAFE